MMMRWRDSVVGICNPPVKAGGSGGTFAKSKVLVSVKLL